MKACFDVVADPAAGSIRLRLAVFFTEADIAVFREALAAGYAKLGPALSHHTTLIDLREIDVQAQASVTDLAGVVADPRYMGRRLAIATGMSLSRSQARRALAGRDAAFFSDLSRAEAWLAQIDPRRAA